MNNISEITPAHTSRDTALDFLKGFLVEIMVIYHIFNYYFEVRPPILLYIDFVTGSFVFISGYLVSSVYQTKYRDNLRKMFFRLFYRGGKLLLLFLLINFAIYSAAIKNYNGYEFKMDQLLANLGSILLAGSAKISAFELLVPIAYTLLLSSILVIISTRALIILPTIALILCVSLFVNQDHFFNLYYISIGLCGVAVGFFSQFIQRSSLTTRAKFLSIVSVSIYYLIISLWGRNNILPYIFGIVSVLFCVYSFASMFTSKNMVIDIFTVLGKYTLICYLAQILFLQILYRSIGGSVSTAISLSIAFVATNLFLYSLCRVIKRLCSTNKYIDKAYLLFFG